MNAFLNMVSKFWALFIWWYTVQPWERALRVRLGGEKDHQVVEHGAGLHFRLPYIDVVYRQTTRLHFVTLEPQTVTTQDSHTITFAGVFGYVVEDLRTLYTTIQSTDTTLQALVQGALAQYISTHPLDECAPDVIEQAVVNELDIARYGLGQPQLSLTTYARVKTYRLIMDEHAIYSTTQGTNNAEHASSFMQAYGSPA